MLTVQAMALLTVREGGKDGHSMLQSQEESGSLVEEVV
jgi:hypothetical protein